MRTLLLTIIIMLSMASSVLAQKAVIDGPDKVRVGELIILSSENSEGSGIWDIDECESGKGSDLSTHECGKKFIAATNVPGEYHFELTVVLDNKLDKAVKKVIVVEDAEPDPIPVPDPEPEPDPIPDPEPDLSEVTKSLIPLIPNDQPTIDRLKQVVAELEASTPAKVWDQWAKSSSLVLQTRQNRSAETEKWNQFTKMVHSQASDSGIKTNADLKSFFAAVAASLNQSRQTNMRVAAPTIIQSYPVVYPQSVPQCIGQQCFLK